MKPAQSAAAVVDVHGHHYPDSYIEACRTPGSPYRAIPAGNGRLTLMRGEGIVLSLPPSIPGVAERLEQMDAAGVHQQWLSIPSPVVDYMEPAAAAALVRATNADLLAYAELGGPRLRVLLNLPWGDPVSSIAEIDHWDDHPAVVGVMTSAHVAGEPIDGEASRPTWDRLSGSDLVTLVHPTTPLCADGFEDFDLSIAVGFLTDLNRAMARLAFSQSVTRTVRTPLLVSHAGGMLAQLLERLDMYWLRRAENADRPVPSAFLRELYFDTALPSRAGLVAALETFGDDHLVLGSDFPQVPGGLDRVVQAGHRLDLSPGAADNVLGRNAERLRRPTRQEIRKK